MNTYENINKADLKIKDWFMAKLDCRQGFHFPTDRPFAIEKETEKAVNVVMEIVSDNGEYDSTWNVWIPKSCFESYTEYEKHIAENVAKMDEGKARYERLVEWAKAHAVKGVRSGLRTATIMKKIAEAGLSYEA